LASPIEGYGVGIFRVSDGSLVRTLTGHTNHVTEVNFSLDGNLIASGSADRTIKIWRVSDGSLVRTLTGHTDEVTSVTFSPDGSLIASGGVDGLALWRVGASIINHPPSAPTLLSPSDNLTLTVLPIQLKLSATDPDPQRLRFKIEILQNGQVVQTFDQTKDTSGWDKPSSYARSETATLTIPQLPSGTYQWRAQAFDGRDWGAVSETYTFTLTLPELPLNTLKTVILNRGDDALQVECSSSRQPVCDCSVSGTSL